MWKTEKLGQCLIKDAQRVWKINLAADIDRVSLPASPGTAGEIAKAIDGHHHRFIIRRYMEGRRQMCRVMLDRYNPPLEHLAGESIGQQAFHARAFTLVTNSIQHQFQIGTFRQGKRNLLAKMRLRILIYSYDIDSVQRNSSLFETVANRLRRKPGPVLDTAKAFLFHSGNQLPITHQTA